MLTTKLGFAAVGTAFLVGFIRDPIVFYSLSSAETFRNPADQILLLTSHPDDESLFFGPTLYALSFAPPPTEESQDSIAQSNVHSICLSVGNADGLGQTRREEYHTSLDLWGIPPSQRLLVDHPHLQDNITVLWDAHVIAETIRPFILEHKITAILTFDEVGISGHPNHRAAMEGSTNLIQNWFSFSPPPQTIHPRLFVLQSKPLHIKYLGFIGAALTKSSRLVRNNLLLDKLYTRAPPPTKSLQRETTTIFVTGWKGYQAALAAMRAHASQMVWFRWLNVAFSQYMWVNEWQEIIFP